MNETNAFLGKEKIGKLLLKFSLPCILSMVIGALYNIVDQLFIGNSELGYFGNAATSIVYPITIIVLAFALMWRDGCAAYMSIAQGKKDTSKVNNAIGTCLIASLLMGLIIAMICGFLAEPILTAFGASGQTLTYAKTYLYTLLPGIPFYLIATMLVSVVRADGSPKYSMIATLTGCFVNIALDPLFVFAFKMGMVGAALATVIGQLSCFIFMLVYFIRGYKTFKLKLSSFKPNFPLLGKASQMGLSSFLTNISTVVLSIVTNILLSKYGSTSIYGADIPIAVIGIVFKVFGIIISIAVGVAIGGQPILGCNYGAKNYDRVKETFKLIMIIDVIIGIVATVLVEAIPQYIIQLFGSDGGNLYIEYACYAFRIYLMLILFACLTKAMAIFFQSIERPFTAIIIALGRDIVLLIPGLIIASAIGGENNGVVSMLWGAPISDVISLIIGVFLVINFFKKISKKQSD